MMFPGWFIEMMATESHILWQSNMLAVRCDSLREKAPNVASVSKFRFIIMLHHCSFLTEESSPLFVCGTYLYIIL